MLGPNAVTLRGVLPALAVSAVLAMAALLPSSPIGLANVAGYGYANNCGIKGYGTHDHGKACPNRPFPGKGKGLLKAVQSGATGSGAASASTTDETMPEDSGAVSENDDDSTGTNTNEQGTRSGQSQHGRGHGLAGSHPGD